LLAAFARVASAQDMASVAGLADLTLEQLSSIQVTSVSGRPESISDAAASIFVITADDIRRSAATSLPEALRLAPNLQVAQLNASQYAISARGFNNAIGNKLLVLVDGRTIYSPLFSGVFWDQNDVMLQDIERIEVISGPGGTLWGANAVNGVINIITRPAADTQGLLASSARSGSGGYEAVRQGGTTADGVSWRVYAMAMDHGNTFRADHVARADAAAKHQAGFRIDWPTADGSLTLQGDAYEGGKRPASNLAPLMSGGNLLARWQGRLPGGAPFTLQGYLDEVHRDDVNAFRERASTADLQFSSEPAMPAGHQLLWGFGLRDTQEHNPPSPAVAFIPMDRALRWGNVFVQDDWRFTPAWQLTLGGKLESNVYTGVEFMPNLRLSYKHSPTAMTWAAVSRAVRAPARLDREFYSPGRAPYVIAGGPDFISEVATVTELGHRGYLASGISYSITAFRQDYGHLRSGTSTAPAMLINQIEGHVDGVEAWGNWQVRPGWRLGAGLLALRKHLDTTRGTPDPAGIASLGNDPQEQWSLRSSHDIGAAGQFDIAIRRVGALPLPQVAAYTAVDARFAWKVSPQLELAVFGQNLFDPRHVEFNAVPVASQIPRRVFLSATWRM